jgi:hypothetical protein
LKRDSEQAKREVANKQQEKDRINEEYWKDAEVTKHAIEKNKGS